MKYGKGSFITVPSRDVIRGMDPTAQALYMWLCSYANETGECYPSRATLSKDVGVSPRTIDASMEALVTAGLVKKESRFSNNEQLSNLYSVVVEGGSAKSARGIAKSALPPAQNLRTELNPVLTQSNKPASADSFEEEVRTVEGEEDEPKKVTRSVKEYEEMVRWLEGTTGVKIINRSKQYAHLARARAAGINKTRLKQRVNDLLGEPFYKEHGLDFGGVVSSFDRKP